MRPLRHLPAAVSDLSRARRGDGLAARAHLPHAGGGRRSHRPHPDASRATSTSASAAAAARRPVPRACPSASSSRRRGRSWCARVSARRRAITRPGAGRSRPFPYPSRLAPLLWGLRLYQASGLQALVRAVGVLAPWKRLRAMEALLPAVASVRVAARVHSGARQGRAAARGFSRAASSASSMPTSMRGPRACSRPPGGTSSCRSAQGCCGALHLHAGRLDEFRGLAVEPHRRSSARTWT